MKQNGYWVSRLDAALLLGHDPVAHILGREQRIAAVTAASLKAAFGKYFPMDRHTIVTLVPEK
jgi:predicted Zn-dependent peptidase